MAHVKTIVFVASVVFCVILTSFVVESNKYVDKNNLKVEKLKNQTPFRMNKLNIHWKLAQKKLSLDNLRDLYAEFHIQDKMELEWKKRKTEGSDQSGEEEAALRRKLNAILKTFELAPSFETSVDSAPDGKDVPLDGDFRFNKQLTKLWKKAKMAGFDETEMELLLEEFNHYEEKLKEVATLKQEIDELTEDADYMENTIDGHAEGKDKKRFNQEKHREMKHLHKSLQKDYEYMESLMEDENRRGDFSNPRVIHLWGQAKKANFTEEELLAFKEELQHFEHKLKKQEHLHKQLQLQSLDDGTLQKSNFASHDQLADAVEQYNRKIKKIQGSLKMKLHEKTEL